MIRTLCATALFFAAALRPAGAQARGAAIPVADCSLVDNAAAARILTYPVEDPDEVSESAGICFFASRAVSQDGSLSYAIVTQERLAQRRAYFTALARRCGGIAQQAPRAALCGTYVNLAQATNVSAYFSARTAGLQAVALPGLGDAAFATPGALYVRRGDRVLEIAVQRAETFDLAACKDVAELLLERLPR